MYKLKLFIFVLVITQYTCELSPESINFDTIAFREIIDNYNKEKTPNHKAILIDASIVTEQIEKENEVFLLFWATADNIFRKYQFQYNADKGKINIPEKINNGRIAYIGDNLVVMDLDVSKYYYFIVEDFPHRILDMLPTMEGNGLLSALFNDEESLFRSGSSCTCGCASCGINCDEPWCGTEQASCSCGGNSQSVTCRPCFEASCTSCSDQ